MTVHCGVCSARSCRGKRTTCKTHVITANTKRSSETQERDTHAKEEKPKGGKEMATIMLCGKCKWHRIAQDDPAHPAENEWYCTNALSDNYQMETEYSDYCIDFEER